VAERYRPDEVVVLLGTPTPDASRLYALTVTAGDPSWAGALAGVALGLPVYHVTEPEVKAQIAPGDYEEHVALMEMAMDAAAIGAAVAGVRREGPGPSGAGPTSSAVAAS
jgi:glycine reductase